MSDISWHILRIKADGIGFIMIRNLTSWEEGPCFNGYRLAVHFRLNNGDLYRSECTIARELFSDKEAFMQVVKGLKPIKHE